MTQSAEVRCRCGKVEGRALDAVPDSVNRIVCYCDDCQAFLHHLGRRELMDEHGGTDIVQIAPASLSFQRGVEQIAGVRLASKGMYRWYARCCKTPLGNTVSTGIPFVGIPSSVFDPAKIDGFFGKPRAKILGKFAIGTPPQGSTNMHLGLLVHAIWMILGWKLGGRTWPHPFFDRATTGPAYPVTVLSSEEREALRPLCGPRAAIPTTV